MNTGTPNGSKLLTAEELADRFQIPVGHVYRLTRGGQLPVVKLGRYKRYRVADVEQFEQSGGTEDTEARAA